MKISIKLRAEQNTDHRREELDGEPKVKMSQSVNMLPSANNQTQNKRGNVMECMAIEY